MSEQDQARKEQYKRVRSDFDDLDTEDKFLFLLEATVSTVARGIDQFGRAVSDEINKAFHRRAERKSQQEEEEEPSQGSGASDGGAPESPNGSTATDENRPQEP